MPNLKLINIADNHLIRLTEATWQPIWSTLLDVYLQGNPFICDCHVRWLVQKESEMAQVIKVNRYLYGRCFTPSYLKDKRLEDLKLSDVECK
ncbi:slit homolog 2 protein-like [Limulus polyphemus]|uniref:Slit homolog 2 protein-like n=1 Tax=Limulus polyphemus TaxID=6850 RepID=A0ABM1SP86_LIMPO|nr:slit homolog 2 protein-like [Limulus polyphemus]